MLFDGTAVPFDVVYTEEDWEASRNLVQMVSDQCDQKGRVKKIAARPITFELIYWTNKLLPRNNQMELKSPFLSKMALSDQCDQLRNTRKYLQTVKTAPKKASFGSQLM